MKNDPLFPYLALSFATACIFTGVAAYLSQWWHWLSLPIVGCLFALVFVITFAGLCFAWAAGIHIGPRR
jgi:Flp pilus assembly protein TadB